VRLVLERERVGTPAQTYTPPTFEFPDWEDFYPGDYGGSGEFELPDFWLGAGANAIAAIGADGYLYLTADFTADPPTWERVNLATLGLSGVPVQFVVDAFSPGYLGTGTAINGWIATNQGIYRIADIFGSVAISLQYSYGYTVYNSGKDWQNAIGLDASFGRQNHVVCVIPQQASCYGASKAIYTVDGVNWSAVNITTYYSSGDYTLAANSVYVSPRTAGLVYAVSLYDTDNRYAATYVSTNYGATWSRVTAQAPRKPYLTQLYFRGTTALHVPYDSNANEDDVYYCRHLTADNLDQGKVYRLRAGVHTDITPSVDGGSWVAARSRWGLMTAPTDRNYLAAVLSKTFTSAVFTSTNGGDSWSQRQTSTNYRRVAIAGDNKNVLYLWGVDGHIGYSADFGATIVSKRGNIGTFSPAAGELIGICGGPT
jgi:hypothetical protein